jgi:hypothetical protein
MADEMEDMPSALAHCALQIPPGLALDPGQSDLAGALQVDQRSLQPLLLLLDLKGVPVAGPGHHAENFKWWAYFEGTPRLQHLGIAQQRHAAVAGVEWVALTDGAEWRIYNAHAPVPVEHKLFRAVRVAEDIDAAFELLALLSKDNMRDNRLQELWRGFFVDRQVYAALDEVFNAGEPARDLVTLVAKRVPDLSKADIRASLVRARVTFDFPTPSLPMTTVTPATPAAPGSPVPVPTDTPQGPRVRYIPVSKTERRLTLHDVLESGRLPAGSRLETDYMGHHHTAEVLADGQIRFQDETYGSLSSAGVAVKQAVRGPDIPESVRATDGWSFWRATDAQVGDTVTLKTLRQRVAANHSA